MSATDDMKRSRAEGLRYPRVLLKLSGELLCEREGGFGLDPTAIGTLADELAQVHGLGVQLALVVGGGNIFRGLKASASGMDRSTADHMGMLATVMNALALQEALEKRGVLTRVQTALEMRQVAEPYIRRRAVRHLEKGRAVIFAAGTGNPYFSTDTAAALRGMEVGAKALLKATKVEGVYEMDPKTHRDARMFRRLSYDACVERHIGVMDTSAVTLSRDNNLPVHVFKFGPGSVQRVLRGGEAVGTLIDGAEGVEFAP